MKRLLLLIIVLSTIGVSAQKIEDLPAAAALVATDLVIIDQSDATRHITVTNLFGTVPVNLLIEPLATVTTTVLTPTSTGLIDTLETTDLATADITVTGLWTFDNMVADSITSNKIVCDSIYTAKSSAWADYVFEENYQLQDFTDKMETIKTNHYLPALGNNSNLVNLANRIEGIVKELEESYLYIEQLEKRISGLEKK